MIAEILEISNYFMHFHPLVGCEVCGLHWLLYSALPDSWVGSVTQNYLKYL